MRRLAALLLGVMVPRPMQQEAYDRLASARLRRLHSPTGSGKTLLIQIIAMTEMLFEGRRTLIAVPQMNIGRGFKARRVWLPRREWTAPAFLAAIAACAGMSFWHWWCPLASLPLWFLWRRLATRPWAAENLCDGDSDDRVARVEAFIRGGRGNMVCCHASLARAWRRVGSAEGIEGLSLWIDEAHYVKAGGERNGVGEMVHALVRGDESVRVGLATATPCRGDRRDIVHPDDAGKFVVYDCPFDRHFEENMPSVELVELDWIPYSPAAGWDDAVAEWLSGMGQAASRTLFYIPHPTSLLSSPDSPGKPGKITDLERILAAIEKVDPGADVVDLVTDNGDAERERRMRALEARIAAGDDPDYVVALNLMKCGSDWPNLRNVVDLAPGTSLPDTGQKFGRLAREPSHGADKRTITYTYFFPQLGQTGEELRRACSERLASLISLLLLRYAAEAAPLFRRRPEGRRCGGGGNPAMAEPWLGRFLATLASREGGAEHATCVEVARALMDEMDIPEEFRSGLEHIVRHLNRRPSDRTAAAYVDAGFDIVVYGELGTMMILTTGERPGDGLFEKFRRASRKLEKFRSRSTEEWVLEAERLAAENGGVLQSSAWLIRNGYSGLDFARRNNPEMFAHIRQEKNTHTAEEWVPEAERLAAENGGVLPGENRLCKSGYSGLPAAMRNRPELFAHIEQKPIPTRRTPEEWVPEAERLAAENGGAMPPSGWLVQNGYSGLDQAKRKNPGMFSHIRQERNTHTAEEWVPEAERLAAENGGVLPNTKWLRRNGYRGLPLAVRNRPELFAHIKQKKIVGRSPEEWVLEAERLAAERGTLPNNTWLRENGCSGMVTAMSNSPGLFAHIEQDENSRRTPEEWVPVAERLAAENGGVLPGENRLCENGYAGLPSTMRNRPELFAHIGQNKRLLRSMDEWVAVAERLAAEHGRLPSNRQLKKDGFGGLRKAMNKRPELFSHIKWAHIEQNIRRTPEEWVPVAERLAAENGGVLPGETWLRENGYGGLPLTTRNRPELFAHIGQNKRLSRSMDEWVAVAERLAAEHGRLPSWRRLKKYGFGGLRQAMNKRPELFSHIKWDS